MICLSYILEEGASLDDEVVVSCEYDSSCRTSYNPVRNIKYCADDVGHGKDRGVRKIRIKD